MNEPLSNRQKALRDATLARGRRAKRTVWSFGVLVALIALLSIGWAGTVIYVLWHFIGKYW